MEALIHYEDVGFAIHGELCTTGSSPIDHLRLTTIVSLNASFRVFWYILVCFRTCTQNMNAGILVSLGFLEAIRRLLRSTLSLVGDVSISLFHLPVSRTSRISLTDILYPTEAPHFSTFTGAPDSLTWDTERPINISLATGSLTRLGTRAPSRR